MSFPRKFTTRTLSVLTGGFALTGLIGTSACNFKYEKEADDNGSQFAQGNAVGYAQINAALFAPKCLGCHSTKAPLLTSYEAVASNIAAIEKSVLVKQSMPKKGALTKDLQAMLRTWIDAGIPREGSGPVVAIPPRAVADFPRPYTFAHLKPAVLDSKCNQCHSTGNPDGITPLDTYEGMMSVKDLIEPLIFTKDKELMPPLKSPAMTNEEKALVLVWLADGAIEAPAPSPTPAPTATALPSPSPEISHE